MRPSRLNNILKSMQDYDDKQLKKFVLPEKVFSSSEFQTFEHGINYFVSLKRTNKSNPELLANVLGSFGSLVDELNIQLRDADSKSTSELISQKIENFLRLMNSIGMTLFGPNGIINIDDGLLIYKFFYTSIKSLRKTLNLKPNKDKLLKDTREHLTRKYIDCCDALSVCNLKLGNIDSSISYIDKQLAIFDFENVFNQEESIVRKSTIFTTLAQNALKQLDLTACCHFLREAYKTMQIEMKDVDLLRQYQIGRDYLNTLDQLINLISDEINFSNADLLRKLIKAMPSQSVDYQPYQKKLTTVIEKAMQNLAKKASAESPSSERFDPADVFPFIDILKRSKQTNILTYAKKADNFICNKNIRAIRKALEGKTFDGLDFSEDQDKKNFIISFKAVPENSFIITSEFHHHGFSYRINTTNDKVYFEVPVDISEKEFFNLVENLSKTQIFAINSYSATSIETNLDTKLDDQRKDDHKEVVAPVGGHIHEESNKSPSKKEIYRAKTEANKKAQQPAQKPTEQKQEQEALKKRVNKKALLPDKTFYTAQELGFGDEFNGEKIYLLRSPLYPRLAYCAFYSRNNMEDKLAEDVHTDNERILEIGKISSKSPCIKYVKDQKHTFKIAGLTESRVVSTVVGVSTLFPNVRLLRFDGDGLLINHKEQERKLYRGKN